VLRGQAQTQRDPNPRPFDLQGTSACGVCLEEVAGARCVRLAQQTLNLALLDTQGTWTCGMCLEEVAGARCVRPAPCAHFFCAACVRGQLAVHVADGALDALRCPEPDCRTPYLREARGAAHAIPPCVPRAHCADAVGPAPRSRAERAGSQPRVGAEPCGETCCCSGGRHGTAGIRPVLSLPGVHLV